MTKITSYKDILKAQKKLKDRIFQTPLERSRSASEWVQTNVYLKFENQQLTGSFKVRGALNKILSLVHEEKKGESKNLKKTNGFLAASAGNHAQGVAYAAKQVKKPSCIFMSKNSSFIKIKATKSYGAEVILKGESFDEAYQYAKFFEKKKNYTFIHPFEDSEIIAGQGTVGLEIINKIPDLDSIVVPIGGGGLISGIALAIKSVRPQCKVFGAVLESHPGMSYLYHQSKTLKKNKDRKDLSKNLSNQEAALKDYLASNELTIADGVAVKSPSLWMHDHYISKYIDDIILVNEALIAEAVVFLMERAKTIVEASGAMGLAAAIQGRLPLGQKTCIVLSGGNIDLHLISKVIEKGLTKLGRIARLAVVVKDQPGVLEALLKIIAKEKVNVLEVRHERSHYDLSLNEVKTHFLLNTFDFKQLEKIKKELKKIGVLVL